jgi:hypothetical protein
VTGKFFVATYGLLQEYALHVLGAVGDASEGIVREVATLLGTTRSRELRSARDPVQIHLQLHQRWREAKRRIRVNRGTIDRAADEAFGVAFSPVRDVVAGPGPGTVSDEQPPS